MIWKTREDGSNMYLLTIIEFLLPAFYEISVMQAPPIWLAWVLFFNPSPLPLKFATLERFPMWFPYVPSRSYRNRTAWQVRCMAAVLLLIGSGLEEANVIDELFLFSLNLLVGTTMGGQVEGSSWWYRSCFWLKGHRLSHDILASKTGDLHNDLFALYTLVYFYLF